MWSSLVRDQLPSHQTDSRRVTPRNTLIIMGQLAVVSDLPSSLPADLTGFVGRRAERSEVRRLLSKSRLVTLTGLGGVGKTRLALRVATELRRVMPDGVWFVPLGELSDPDLIAETTAAALGINDRSGPSGVGRLAEYLRPRELLLVLDNCEHLIDDCADLAEALLRACPRLRILATSREALRVEGEAVRPVAPLSVPHSQSHLRSSLEYEAVRLFVQRASLAVPGFTVDDESRPTVLGICQHLEGIPLALELAAVRLRSMSPTELLERLHGHWELLDLGSRSAPDRHRTMTACIEWSHGLCSPEERDLWEILSVFAGGVEMDAIQFVAGELSRSSEPVDIAHLVQALVDKSVLTIELHNGRGRYRMHEVLRQFGLHRLESAGSLSDAWRRLRDFYLDLLIRIDDDWMSPRQIVAMQRVRRETANIRVALEFCCTEPDEAVAGLDIASRMRRYSLAYGGFTEGRQWLGRLLALVPAPGMARVQGLRAACWLAAVQGDSESSSSLLTEARRVADVVGGQARFQVDQVAGWHQMFFGDRKGATESLTRALDGFRMDGNLLDATETYTLLGMAYGLVGDIERAVEHHQASLDIGEQTGAPWERSNSLWHLGLLAWANGDLAQAVALEKQSLDLKRRLDERVGVALCFEALAWIHSEAEPRRAATLFGAADRLWTTMDTTLEALPGLSPMRQSSEERVRVALESAFNAAHREGADMGSDAAIAYALEEEPTGGVAAETSRTNAAAALTNREREIAELVAAGLTNKAIASKLVISPRTVETHVEHILIKLGFNTRIQVAAWISEQAGEPGPTREHPNH
jgi:predicted ATPase/DNA-binding CsgD family transcriptional regulator